MNKIAVLIVCVLAVVWSAPAQSAERRTVVADEFNFIAFFPDQPTFTEAA